MNDDTKALVTHGLRLSVALCAEDVRALDTFIAQLGESRARTIERLERELAEAQRDARRYRWLREPLVTGGYVAEGAEADAAIDAAMGGSDE